MSAIVAGIATAVPRHRIHQADAVEIARSFSCETRDQERRFAAIFRLSGVETRHSAVLDASVGERSSRQSFYGATSPTTRQRMDAYEQHAGPLAARAAGAALADAEIQPEAVTHVITVSCSGFAAPGIDQTLIRRLGLSPAAARTHIGFMGCHGLLNGLRVARAFVDSDRSACVLLCAAELCSLHFQYGWDPDRMVANALFADGAAAMVVLPGAGPHRPGAFRVLGTGSALLPDSADAMSWRVGDHGFTMTLSPRVPELIGAHIRPWLADWLARHGRTIESIAAWAVHPGGPRILSVFGEAVGLDPRALTPSFRVLAEHGNMSSPTIAFILDRLRIDAAPGPCVAIAFGPGLAVEAALLDRGGPAA